MEDDMEESVSPVGSIRGLDNNQLDVDEIEDSENAKENKWYEIKDETSKRTFYYNEQTQVTQWERPENAIIQTFEQRGIAIILGDGVIEKDYENARSQVNMGKLDNHIYVSRENHLFDPIQHTQAMVFQSNTPESYTTPISEQEISPTAAKPYVLIIYTFIIY